MIERKTNGQYVRLNSTQSGEDMFMELDKNIYLIDQKYHTSDMKHPLIISRITNIN